MDDKTPIKKIDRYYLIKNSETKLWDICTDNLHNPPLEKYRWATDFNTRSEAEKYLEETLKTIREGRADTSPLDVRVEGNNGIVAAASVGSQKSYILELIPDDIDAFGLPKDIGFSNEGKIKITSEIKLPDLSESLSKLKPNQALAIKYGVAVRNEGLLGGSILKPNFQRIDFGTLAIYANRAVTFSVNGVLHWVKNGKMILSRKSDPLALVEAWEKELAKAEMLKKRWLAFWVMIASVRDTQYP